MNCECLNTKYALISQNILVGGETGVFHSLQCSKFICQMHICIIVYFHISPLCTDLKENYEI